MAKSTCLALRNTSLSRLKAKSMERHLLSQWYGKTSKLPSTQKVSNVSCYISPSCDTNWMVPLSVTKVPSAPRAAKEARDAAKFWNLEGHMSYVVSSHANLFFCPGSAAGAAALNPAMPRRVVWEAKHSFSYPGARPCRRPSPKILQPAGVFTFLGVRGGKKEGKIWRCVLEVLVGRFLVDFWSFFLFFWYCPRVKIV